MDAVDGERPEKAMGESHGMQSGRFAANVVDSGSTSEGVVRAIIPNWNARKKPKSRDR